MTQRFVISLGLEARRAAHRVDLAQYVSRELGLEVLERASGGKSVIVECAAELEPQLRDRLPFAVVEADIPLSLL